MPDASIGSRERSGRAPRMSVLVSVWDGDDAGHLGEALESILKQTWTDFEVVLVEDYTRADLGGCVRDFAGRDPRIRLVSTAERLSHGGALNLAMMSARGDVLVHQDSDDISAPHRLERLMSFLDTHTDVDIVGSFTEEFDETGKPLGILRYPLDHDSMRRQLCRRNPIAHGSVAQRRASLARTGYYVRFSVNNEDTLYWLNAFRAGARFANIPEVLYRVRFISATTLRRVGVRKAASDLTDRLRVIIDLRGGWRDAAAALALFLIQVGPTSFYSYVRARMVRTP